MESPLPSRGPSEYCFGPFEANLREGELRKHGIRVKLHEKSFQILAALLERPAELVTREELRARLWEANTFVDFEHSLDAAINKLRATLGDSAEAPRYVETVRGRGYRFLGAVTKGIGFGRGRVSAPDPEATPPPAMPAPSVREIPADMRRHVLRAAFGVASVALLLVAAVLEWAYPAPASPLAPQNPPRNPLALEYFLRGGDLAAHSNYKGSMTLLEKSVALEPTNAMAWTILATNYIGYARNQGGGQVYEEKGWQAFEKALALDPGNSMIVDPMAFHLIERGEIERAVTFLREVLHRNGKDPWAHWFLSEAYRYGGILAESLREGDVAHALDPSAGAGTFQNTYLYVGEYEKFLRSLPAEESARTNFYRGLAYVYLKDAPRAAVEFDHAFALDPTLLHSQLGEALEFALTGQQAKGMELMRGINAAEIHDGEMVYKMAQAYAQLGDKASSLRLLRRSIDLNFYPYAYFAQDPLLDPIRAEAEYASVMDLARQNQESFRKRFF